MSALEVYRHTHQVLQMIFLACIFSMKKLSCDYENVKPAIAFVKLQCDACFLIFLNHVNHFKILAYSQINTLLHYDMKPHYSTRDLLNISVGVEISIYTVF